MSVSKYRIRQTNLSDKTISIPIELNWDYLGLDMSIDEYESNILEQVVGTGFDFEISRFEHAVDNKTQETKIKYQFFFHSGDSLDNIESWDVNYINAGFTPQDVYYYTNRFSNSFFKLDFYDTMEDKTQANYLSIIIPTQQGEVMITNMQTTQVSIKKPEFNLDYVGDVEGFFIYWLKNRNFLDISTFYMTAKFFNANTGQFVKMMNSNGPQSKLGDKYVFESSKYFYYKVKLNYDTQTYEVFNSDDLRVGNDIPINWYEYVDPK